MARPSRITISNGSASWDADVNDNFQLLFDTPLPVATYASSGSLPAAASYENCIAICEDDDKVYTSDGATWSEVGGAGAFTDLSDTPASLSGEGGKTVKVNSGGTALEFVTVEGVTAYSKRRSQYLDWKTTEEEQNFAWVTGDQATTLVVDHGALANDAWDAAGSFNVSELIDCWAVFGINGDFDETDTYYFDGKISAAASAQFLRIRWDRINTWSEIKIDNLNATGGYAKAYWQFMHVGDPDISGQGYTHYSTDEQKTGVNWIDGRAVYRKTVNTGEISESTNNQTAHGISNLRDVIHIEGATVYDASPDDSRPLPCSTKNGTIAAYVDSTNINLDCTNWDLGTPTSFEDSYVSIYYTKDGASDDASESDLGTKKGIDYSLAEQKMHFTVEGDEVYRKVIYVGTLPNNDTLDVPHNISNFKTPFKVEGCCEKTGGSNQGFYSMPLVDLAAPWGVVMTVDADKISITSEQDETDHENCYVILYYTKTDAGEAELSNVEECDRIIQSDRTIYLDSSGNDSTGDGSNASPWLTLEHAFDVLNKYRISKAATVTIDVASGTYSSVPGVTIKHPDAGQIKIVGSEAASASDTITGVNVGTKTISVAGDQTANYPAGMVVSIMGSTDNDSTYTVASSSFGATTDIVLNQAPQSATADGTIRNHPASDTHVFEMAASQEIIVQGTNLHTFSGICIEGDSGTPARGLVVQRQAQIANCEGLVVKDCTTGIEVAYASDLSATIPVVHNCTGSGIYCHDLSSCTFDDGGLSCFNGARGFYCNLQSSMSIGYDGAGDSRTKCVASNNTSAGIYVVGISYTNANYCQAINNGAQGIYVQYNSFFSGNAATAINNTSHGIYVIQDSATQVANAVTTDNGGSGLNANQRGLIVASNGTSDDNGAYGVLADEGSHVDFSSGSATGNTTAATSPATNTVGNANSYITS